MKAELVAIATLKPYDGNPRRGNVDVIRESLRENGQYRPIVVRTETREVLAGNHTMKAAIAEGWDEIWCTFVECDPDTARRINLVDNRAPELGGYDEPALIAMLQELPQLDGTGWTTDDLLALLPPQAPDGVAGENPEPAPAAQMGVLLLCLNKHHQQRVEDQLRDIQAGGEIGNLVAVLQDVQFQPVSI